MSRARHQVSGVSGDDHPQINLESTRQQHVIITQCTNVRGAGGESLSRCYLSFFVANLEFTFPLPSPPGRY